MKTEIIMVERQQVRQELGESELRYRRLLEATSDYIYTVNVEHGRSGVTSHGLGCEAVTGYTSAEFASDAFLWYRLIHEEDRAAVLAQVDRILKGETPSPLDHRIITKRGCVRWVRNTTIPHCNADGELVAYDGLISDITGRKQAELLLAAEYAVTRDLMVAGSLADAMPAVLEDLCRTLLWHHAVHWRSVEGVLRRETSYWHPPFRIAEFETECTPRTLARGEGLAGRVQASGESVWVSDICTVPELGGSVPSAAGLHAACAFPLCIARQGHGVIALYSREARPMDERMLNGLGTVGVHIGQFVVQRQAEEKLEQERNLLRTLVDNVPDCIFFKDAESRFLLNNAAHLRMLGAATPQDALGKTDADFFPAGLATKYRADEMTILESGQPLINYEEPVVDRAGRHFCFLCTKVPLRDSAGKAIGLVGIGRDITERKRAAEQLERANASLDKRGRVLRKIVHQLRASHQELKEAQLQLIQAAKLESLGTLAAGVAHEVKNPLQTILMGLDYLFSRFPRPDKNLALALQDMHDAVKRADNILREMLALSANADFHWELESLNTVIERSLLLVKNSLIASHIVVNLELAPGLPKLLMDSQKMQQVFINICLNGVQAMSAGGTLTVRTRSLQLEEAAACTPFFRKFSAGDDLVVAEVQDTGPGLSETALSRAFDPFFTTKPVGAGTGLGLSVVKKIVDMHGGNIEIKNAPHGGARVAVVLKNGKEGKI